MSGSETTLLKWSVRGRDRRPEGIKGIVAAMFVAAALGLWLLGPFGVLLGPAIIAATMSDFLFGKQFELTEQDARSRVLFSLSVLNWTDVQRVIQSDSSLLLSPLAQGTWRDGFRGIQLELLPTVRDRALEIVRERAPAEATYSVE